MHSDQWQSYFLCQGQSPVYFRQDERERLDWWTVHRQKRSLLLLLLLLLSPWIASFSESVDSEFILRDFTCSVSPALPAGTITSLSDYNLPPTVLPVHKKERKRKHFLEPQAGMSHVLPSTPTFTSTSTSTPYQPPSLQLLKQRFFCRICLDLWV